MSRSAKKRPRGRSGGRAGGAGYGFQDTYIALQLVKLLVDVRDPPTEILWEKKVVDWGDGAEALYVDDVIICSTSGRKTYVQVKETPSRQWTAKEVVRSGILAQFWREWYLKTPDDRATTILRLASAGDVGPLSRIVDVSRRARTPNELLSDEASIEVAEGIRAISEALSIEPADPLLLAFLQSIEAEQLPAALEIENWIANRLMSAGDNATDLSNRLIRLVTQSKHSGPSARSSYTRDSLIDVLRHDGVAENTLIAIGGVREHILAGPFSDETKERESVRLHENELCSKLNLFGRTVPIEHHYQLLPLLQEIKKDNLLRSEDPEERNGEDDPFTELRGFEVQRWEESLRGERITYERRTLERVFSSFGTIVKEATNKVPRFFLLGPPGSGKTTLTQYLAWASTASRDGANENDRAARLSEASGLTTNLVAARITMRDWEKWATKPSDPENSLPEYLAEQYKDLTNAPTVKHWQAWLRRGGVLLLFDGLDEIAGDRYFIDALRVALAVFSDCPTVLTCRTVSFEQHRAVASDFPIFTLAGLADEQRNAFIRAFPGRNNPDVAANALIAQLDGAFQMRALAANPLLLSIICYVTDGSTVASVPTTRGGLYDKVIDRLLKRERGLELQPTNDRVLSLTRKRRILERAALSLFAGTPEQKLTFDEGSVIDALTAAAEQEGYGADTASIADALLTDVNNSGILRGDSSHGYNFLHLTIEEFLAAAAIATAVNENGWKDEIRLGELTVTPRRIVECKSWEARWSEVVKLLAGQLQDPSPLFDLLVDEQSDDYFRHRLALAAECLPELDSETLGSQADLINQITETLFQLWHDLETKWVQGTEHIVKSLPSLVMANGLVHDSPLTTVLCDLLKNKNEDWRLRSTATRILGQLGKGIAQWPESISALMEGLVHDEESTVSSNAAWALVQVGQLCDPKLGVIPDLLVATEDQDPKVRRRAVAAFGMAGEHTIDERTEIHSIVFSVLMSALQDKDSTVRNAAIEAFKNISKAGSLPNEVTSKLTVALLDEDGWVRHEAFEALEQVDQISRLPLELVYRYVECVLRDLNSNWSTIAFELMKLDKLDLGHPEVFHLITAALLDENPEVRRRAALAADEIKDGAIRFPSLLPALVDRLLHDEDSEVRRCTGLTLCRMRQQIKGDSEILALVHSVLDGALETKAVLDGALDTKDRGAVVVRKVETAIFLNRLILEIPDAPYKLITALKSENVIVRGWAAIVSEGLCNGLYSETDLPDTMSSLISALADCALRDDDHFVRATTGKALRHLGKLALNNPQVRLLHQDALRDTDPEVRSNAAWAIMHLEERDAHFASSIAQLMKCALRDKDPKVRAQAISSLGQIAENVHGNPALVESILDTIEKALRDTEWEVRHRAATTLYLSHGLISQHSGMLPVLLKAALAEKPNLKPSDLILLILFGVLLKVFGKSFVAFCGLLFKLKVQKPFFKLGALFIASLDTTRQRLISNQLTIPVERMMRAGWRIFRKQRDSWAVHNVAELSSLKSEIVLR